MFLLDIVVYQGPYWRTANATMASSTRQKILNTLQLSKDYTVKPAGLQWRSNTYFSTYSR